MFSGSYVLGGITPLKLVDYFGSAVVISCTDIIIGARDKNEGVNNNAGAGTDKGAACV